MASHNPFKRHNKQPESDNQIENDNRKHAPSSTTTDVKEPQPSIQDPAPLNEQAHPPTYSTSAQSQPPTYRSDKPDPFDPTGPAYGYQYEDSAQNFPHPGSVAKDIGKEMKYADPKAAEIARRASQGGREDLTEMMNYFLRQQELGKKSTDNTIAAWNGV